MFGVGGSSKQVHVVVNGESLRRRDFSFQGALGSAELLQNNFATCVDPGFLSLENLKIHAEGYLMSKTGEARGLKFKSRRIQELRNENRSWRLNFSTETATRKIYLR